jgi:hypothetical protein
MTGQAGAGGADRFDGGLHSLADSAFQGMVRASLASDRERASQISLRRVSVFRAGTSTTRPFLVSVLDAVAVRSVSLNTPT